MLKRFFPKEYAESITTIDYQTLYKKGIRGLIYDIDNTIEGYDSKIPSKEKSDLLLSLIENGFSICLVSNNNHERVLHFNSELRFPAIYKAGKPKKSVVSKAAALMNLTPKSTAIIGDQIFTDIWCGNRCNIHTILVKPVTSSDPWLVKLKRLPEKLILKLYLKK